LLVSYTIIELSGKLVTLVANVGNNHGSGIYNNINDTV